MGRWAFRRVVSEEPPSLITPAHRWMGHLSDIVANAAAHPASQIVVIVLCLGWLVLGGNTTPLASVASIGGLILTQMVLNQQRRRDIALHLKIDELILSKDGARDEVAGIEQKTEDEMERVRAGRDSDQPNRINP